MLSFTLSNIREYICNSCFNVLILPFYCFCHLCHFQAYSLIAFSLSKEPHFPESLPYWSDVWGSILTRIILWTEGPGVGLQRVGHVWSDWACTHTCMHRHCEFYIFSSVALDVCSFVVIYCFEYFLLCSGTQLSNLKTVRSLESLLLSFLFREVQNSLSFKLVRSTQLRTLLHAPCFRRYFHSSRKWCKLWRFSLLLLSCSDFSRFLTCLSWSGLSWTQEGSFLQIRSSLFM